MEMWLMSFVYFWGTWSLRIILQLSDIAWNKKESKGSYQVHHNLSLLLSIVDSKCLPVPPFLSHPLNISYYIQYHICTSNGKNHSSTVATTTIFEFLCCSYCSSLEVSYSCVVNNTSENQINLFYRRKSFMFTFWCILHPTSLDDEHPHHPVCKDDPWVVLSSIESSLMSNHFQYFPWYHHIKESIVMFVNPSKSWLQQTMWLEEDGQIWR